MQIVIFSDPGHAWFRVQKSLLEELGIYTSITSYSYVKGKWVYLEEDCDGPLLIKTLKKKNIPYTILEKPPSKNSSRIRSYERYTYDHKD